MRIERLGSTIVARFFAVQQYLSLLYHVSGGLNTFGTGFTMLRLVYAKVNVGLITGWREFQRYCEKVATREAAQPYLTRLRGTLFSRRVYLYCLQTQ